MRDEIYNLLMNNGEMGVSQLAKKLGKPVATVQKFLTNQSTFLKTENRKWTLPGSTTVRTHPNKTKEEINKLKYLLAAVMDQFEKVELMLQTKQPNEVEQPKEKKPVQVEANYVEVQRSIDEALDTYPDLWLRPLWENIDLRKLHNNINALYAQSEKDGDDFSALYETVLSKPDKIDDLDIDISKMFPLFQEILEKSQKD